MKGKKLLLIPLLLVLTGAFLYIVFTEKVEEEQKETEKIKAVISDVIIDEEMLEIIRLDATGLTFLEGYDNFKISTKKLLNKEEIEKRKKEGDFKEIFEPLLIEDERYLKVRLDDWDGGRGIVGTIDIKESKPVIIHFLFLKKI
jgi:hypothetical protein